MPGPFSQENMGPRVYVLSMTVACIIVSLTSSSRRNTCPYTSLPHPSKRSPQNLLEEYVERRKKRRSDHREIDDRFLNWRPYVAPEEPVNPPSKNNNNNNVGNNSNNNANDRKKKNPNIAKNNTNTTND